MTNPTALAHRTELPTESSIRRSSAGGDGTSARQPAKRSPLAAGLALHRGKALLAILAGTALLWSYWPVLCEMAARWAHNPRYSHGFLVPFFACYLLSTRRPERSGLVPASCPALSLFAAGAALRLFSAYFFMSWFEPVSLLVSLAGVSLLMGGWSSLRRSWPSIAFLIFMVPLPFRIEGSLGAPLQRLATVASACVLQVFGLPAFSSGNIIVIDDFRIGVIEACNGLGMAYMFLACSVGAALLVGRPFLDSAILIASAAPIALAANIARIVATGLLHEAVGGRIAAAVYHDLAGWLMMLMALVILWLECKLIPHLFIETTPDNPDTVATDGDLFGSDERVVTRTDSPRVVPGLVALSIVIATAILTGQWANRWKTSNELDVAVARLDRVPLVIGDWAGRAEPIDPRAMAAEELDGFLVRRYENGRIGRKFGVLLACGRPGPVAVHTPDVCYPGAGYEIAQTQPQRSVLRLGTGHADAEFLWARFRRDGSITRDGLCVQWSWNATNKWSAPNNPLFAFAGQRFLYKLYVISEMTGEDEPADVGVETDFLRQLLPELEKVLFPASGADRGAGGDKGGRRADGRDVSQADRIGCATPIETPNPGGACLLDVTFDEGAGVEITPRECG